MQTGFPGQGRTVKPSEAGLTLARIEAPLEVLELPAPPVEAALRFQVRNNQLILMVQSAQADADPVRRWVADLDPDRILRQAGERQEHRWLVFEPVPRRWADLVSLFELQQIQATPEGTAQVTLSGSRDHIRDLLEEVGTADLLGIEALPEDEGLLSEPQEEAIRAALHEGYYDVPRGTSLTQLAERLDRSVSSVSELLRRAEGRIVQDYLGPIDVG